MTILGIYLLIFAIFFTIGLPIVLALSISAILLLIISDINLLTFTQEFLMSIDSYSLTAIFFFVFAGELMNSGGMTKRIISAVSKRMGNVPAGLAIVAGISAMIFAAINGSAIATTVAIGSIMVPAMRKENYGAAFSGAVVAAGGVIGPIIPPSIPVILYGAITASSIPKLFIGGLILGVLIGIGHGIVSFITGKKRGYYRKAVSAAAETHIDEKNDTSSKGVIWALFLPIFIMVTVTFGIFTATESAAFAVVYAFIIVTLIYKELDLKKLPDIVRKSMVSTGAVMAIVGSASVVAWILTYNRVPQQITEYLLEYAHSEMAFMIIVFFLLIVVGMIMDLTPAILILSPIFIEPVKQFGIDPVYFGVIFLAILTTGLITPPVGTLIYTSCSMTERPFSEVSRELMPYTIITLVIIFAAVLVPEIVTFLPNLLFK